MLNKVFLEGNLGRDAELKQSQKGENYAKFSFAVWQGEGKESAWYDCAAFKYTVEVAKSLKKGDRVVVSGKLEITTYTKKDGTKGQNNSIIADSISLLAAREKQANVQQQDPYKDVPNRAPVAKKNTVVEDEIAEIPF